MLVNHHVVDDFCRLFKKTDFFFCQLAEVNTSWRGGCPARRRSHSPGSTRLPSTDQRARTRIITCARSIGGDGPIKNIRCDTINDDLFNLVLRLA